MCSGLPIRNPAPDYRYVEGSARRFTEGKTFNNITECEIMGRHANQRAWQEYEHRQQRDQQEHDEAAEPLTEYERAAEWDRDYWDKVDAVRRYASPVRRVVLWDEFRRVG